MIADTSRVSSHNRSRWRAGFALLAIILFSLAVRAPGVSWLVGDGYADDYSFMGDDQRFVDLAKDVEAGMRDGYVHGMTAHALALRAVVLPFFPELNSLQLLRIVSIIFAMVGVLVTYFTARAWSLSAEKSLLAAFFLAAAPTYVVYANFGAADITAVSYFYLTLYVEAKYLRSKDPLWFVLAAILTGAAIAVKLVLALLAPLALLVLSHRGREFVVKLLTASLVVAGSFEFFSYFAYAPWDAMQFVATLQREVISIPGGNGPFRQFALYIWDLPSALSIPIAILFLGGIAGWFYCSIRLISKLAFEPRKWLANPAMPYVVAFAAQAFLILSAGTHVVRHQLFFFPAACVLAAHTTFVLLERGKKLPFLKPLALSLLTAYVAANAIATELLYVKDIRATVATWVDEARREGKTVLALTQWNRIRGTERNQYDDPLAYDRNTLIVSCDIEYVTYLRARDERGSAVIGATTGGLPRADFFTNVFEGRSEFHIVRTIRQPPLSIEQHLIDRQILRPIATSVPKRCVMLARDNTPGIKVERSELWPRYYNTAGW